MIEVSRRAGLAALAALVATAGPARAEDALRIGVMSGDAEVLAAGLLLTGPAMAEGPLCIGTTAGPYAAIMDYAASLAKAQGLD